MASKARPLPPVAELRRLLAYDPETGVLTWLPRAGDDPRTRQWNTRYAGKPAGRTDRNGYVVVGLFGRMWFAHRLAWAVHHGEPPPAGFEIDHRDGNPSNNAASNLRLASRAQNMANARLAPRRRRDSDDLPRGVYRANQARGFIAQTCHNGRLLHLGTFDTPEEAGAAAAAARDRLHGEFARHDTTTEARP